MLDLETLADGPESAAEWHATFQRKGDDVWEARFTGLLPGRYAVLLRTEESRAASTFGAILEVAPGANVVDLGPLPRVPAAGAPLRVEIEAEDMGMWFALRAMVAPATDDPLAWRPVLLDRFKAVPAPPGDVLLTSWLRPPARGPTACWSSVRAFLPPSGTTIPVRARP